jgi:hypothetical protein
MNVVLKFSSIDGEGYRKYSFTDQLISGCSFYIGFALKFSWPFSDWKVFSEHAA